MMVMAIMMANTAMAKDIRVVEISTGTGMNSSYDSSIQKILKSVSGVSKVVSDVANSILTVTYDADKIGASEIVETINKEEPRFEAKQKGEAKTKEWIKAEEKRDKAEQALKQEQEEANAKDQQRQQQQSSSNNSSSKQTDLQQNGQQQSTQSSRKQ